MDNFFQLHYAFLARKRSCIRVEGLIPGILLAAYKVDGLCYYNSCTSSFVAVLAMLVMLIALISRLPAPLFMSAIS